MLITSVNERRGDGSRELIAELKRKRLAAVRKRIGPAVFDKQVADYHRQSAKRFAR